MTIRGAIYRHYRSPPTEEGTSLFRAIRLTTLRGLSSSDRDWMTGWRLSSRDWASRISSRVMDVGSAVTPKTCDQVLTVCADEAGVASHGETGSAGTSRWSDASSVGVEVEDGSADSSASEWSGRKRSGAGSAVVLSAGNASQETGCSQCRGCPPTLLAVRLRAPLTGTP